eukprot:gb/GECG01007163.1/.p1 GENE.gb/GECG01007163.1/~~gb/GECG01007163.1/.p1  ORF type:complete len:1044 (+),score=151.83 gb/GECG01007163.1/:1-3132(+)
MLKLPRVNSRGGTTTRRHPSRMTHTNSSHAEDDHGRLKADADSVCAVLAMHGAPQKIQQQAQRFDGYFSLYGYLHPKTTRELLVLVKQINRNFVAKARNADLTEISIDLRDLEMAMDLIDEPASGLAITQLGIRDLKQNGSANGFIEKLTNDPQFSSGSTRKLLPPVPIRTVLYVWTMTSYAKYYLLQTRMETALSCAQEVIALVRGSSLSEKLKAEPYFQFLDEEMFSLDLSHVLYVKSLAEYQLRMIRDACSTIVDAIDEGSQEWRRCYNALSQNEQQSEGTTVDASQRVARYKMKTLALSDIYELAGELFKGLGDYDTSIANYERSLELRSQFESPLHTGKSKEILEDIRRVEDLFDRTLGKSDDSTRSSPLRRRKLQGVPRKPLNAKGTDRKERQTTTSGQLTNTLLPSKQKALSPAAMKELQKPYNGMLRPRVGNSFSQPGWGNHRNAEQEPSQESETSEEHGDSGKIGRPSKNVFSRIVLASCLLRRWQRGKTKAYVLEEPSLEKFMRGEATVDEIPAHSRRSSQGSVSESRRHDGSGSEGYGVSDSCSGSPRTEVSPRCVEGQRFDKYEGVETGRQEEHRYLWTSSGCYHPIGMAVKRRVNVPLVVASTTERETNDTSRQVERGDRNSSNLKHDPDKYSEPRATARLDAENASEGGNCESVSNNGQFGSNMNANFVFHGTSRHYEEVSSKDQEKKKTVVKDARQTKSTASTEQERGREHTHVEPPDSEPSQQQQSTASTSEATISGTQQVLSQYSKKGYQEDESLPVSRSPRRSEETASETAKESPQNADENIKKRRQEKHGAVMDTFLFSDNLFDAYVDDTYEDAGGDSQNVDQRSPRGTKKRSVSRFSMSIPSMTEFQVPAKPSVNESGEKENSAQIPWESKNKEKESNSPKKKHSSLSRFSMSIPSMNVFDLPSNHLKEGSDERGDSARTSNGGREEDEEESVSMDIPAEQWGTEQATQSRAGGKGTLGRRLFINSLLRESLAQHDGGTDEKISEPNQFFLDCLVRAVRLVALITRLEKYVRQFKQRRQRNED